MPESTTRENLKESKLAQGGWRTLVLELVVVFVGLFAALQLDEYQQQQTFEADQKRYLQRLDDDLAHYLERTDEVVVFLRTTHDAIAHLSASLQRGEVVGGDTASFEHALIYFAHLPSNPMVLTAYEEMLASGMFTALESEELKSAISGLKALNEFVNSNFSWWRNGSMELESVVHEMVEYYDDPGIVQQPGFLNSEPVRRVRYDLAALASDRRITNGFYWARDVMWDWLTLTEILRNDARQVRRLIHAELGSA